MNIIEYALGQFDLETIRNLAKKELERQFKDSLRRGATKTDDPKRVIGVACETLQRKMSAAKSQEFAHELLEQHGIDCRNLIHNNGSIDISTIEGIYEYIGHRVPRRNRHEKQY